MKINYFKSVCIIPSLLVLCTLDYGKYANFKNTAVSVLSQFAKHLCVCSSQVRDGPAAPCRPSDVAVRSTASGSVSVAQDSAPVGLGRCSQRVSESHRTALAHSVRAVAFPRLCCGRVFTIATT